MADTPDTTATATETISNTRKRLFELGDCELLTIKLSDLVLNSGHVPGKLYEYAFKLYLKNNGLENECTTPDELATHNLIAKLDSKPTVR